MWVTSHQVLSILISKGKSLDNPESPSLSKHSLTPSSWVSWPLARFWPQIVLQRGQTKVTNSETAGVVFGMSSKPFKTPRVLKLSYLHNPLIKFKYHPWSLLSYVAPPPPSTRKKKKRKKLCFLLLSSWKTACNYFIFFLGSIISPVQSRTERELRCQGFPNGYSCVGRHKSWLGAVERRGYFSKARRCTLRSSENPPLLPQGQEATLLSSLVFGSQLAHWPTVLFAFMWLCISNISLWLLLLLVMRLQAAHNLLTNFEALQMEMKWPHQIREEIEERIFTESGVNW